MSLTEPWDTLECVNEEQMSVIDFAHARDDGRNLNHFAHARRHIFV